ncbi:MAG: hypothetical protein H6727_21185 [Myxococcales bacterium]|nr:hypothetical protein [Myxococcales bacterium]
MKQRITTSSFIAFGLALLLVRCASQQQTGQSCCGQEQSRESQSSGESTSDIPGNPRIDGGEAVKEIPNKPETNTSDAGEENANDASSKPETSNADVRIRLSFGGKKVIVKLHDNPTSKDFLSLLPLTVTLSDYVQTEKIAHLPRKLSTKDAPSGFDPSVGDVTYYAPWGNLAIFYKDFGYAAGLVSLGVIESGLQELSALNGTTVTIERIK